MTVPPLEIDGVKLEIPVPVTVHKAAKYFNYWLVKFGFSDWRVEVNPIREVNKGKVWAHCYWHYEESFVIVETVPDGVLPDKTLKALMCHEAAHGLACLASSSPVNEEVFCNRIARAFMPKTPLPNEWNAENTQWWTSTLCVDGDDD